MTHSLSDAPADRSEGTEQRESSDKTIVMNPGVLNPAVGKGPESRVADRLETASSLLEVAAGESFPDDAVADAVDPTGGGVATNDPTIEEYMAALIARSRGGSTASRDTVSMKEFSPTPTPTPTPRREEERPPTPSPAVAWTQIPATERREAICELRELANISARTSFNIHLGQRLVFEMYGRLMVAVVALTVALILVLFTPSMTSVPFAGAVVAWSTALAWTWKYFGLGRQLSSLCFPLLSEDALAETRPRTE